MSEHSSSWDLLRSKNVLRLAAQHLLKLSVRLRYRFKGLFDSLPWNKRTIGFHIVARRLGSRSFYGLIRWVYTRTSYRKMSSTQKRFNMVTRHFECTGFEVDKRTTRESVYSEVSIVSASVENGNDYHTRIIDVLRSSLILVSEKTVTCKAYLAQSFRRVLAGKREILHEVTPVYLSQIAINKIFAVQSCTWFEIRSKTGAIGSLSRIYGLPYAYACERRQG